MMFQITLIFYPHHTVMHSEMLYANGSFDICQELNVCEAASNTQMKHLLAAEKNIYAQAKIIKSLQDVF